MKAQMPTEIEILNNINKTTFLYSDMQNLEKKDLIVCRELRVSILEMRNRWNHG
jgi:hypothetical protein